MRQVVNGSFPFASNGLEIQLNLADAAVGANSLTTPQSGPTNGNTIYVQDNNLQPKPNQRWNFISCSLQAYLSIIWNGFDTGGGFTSNWVPGGKLGAIVGGIILDEYTNSIFGPGGPSPAAVFGYGFMQPLPKDKTLVDTLWDPNIHDLPFVQSLTGVIASNIDQNLSHYLSISATINPPNPVQIKAGILPTMGIWMYPSVHTVSPGGGNGIGVSTPPLAEMILCQASYNITYDDGLPP